MRNWFKFCLTCLGIAIALRLAFEAVTGQSVEMPNAPASTYHPPFCMWLGQEQNENPESSAAEITKWRKEAEEAHELWLKQDTVQGIPKFENLLPQTELVFGKDSKTVALVLYRIGFLYCKRGDFQRALPYIERSLKLLSPLPDNAENLGIKADLYSGLGLSYSARFELDRAIQAFNESLKLKEKLVGADDPSLVKPLIEIAQLHSAQERPTDGIPLLERALAISEKKFGTQSTETARALMYLGNTRAAAGQFEPAIACLRQSLQIHEKLSPPTSPDLGTATSSLGTIYLKIGDYGQAMPLLERSIPLLEKSYVPHNAVSAGQFASALNTLATAQLSIGEYDKGISTFQRSVAVNELAFGSASINR